MNTQAKRALGNLALVLGALAAAFVLGEVATRLLYRNETVLYPRYHTDYRYGRYAIRGIRPNAEFWHTSVDGTWRFVTNSRGFRNERDFPYAKPAQSYRVLSLGDSHTQGYEVRQDQTFSAVLERYLARRGIAAEVINAGVSGFSNAEELAFLENEGVKYMPDAVVLGFFANDFEDNLKSGLFGLDAGGALREEGLEHLPGVGLQNLIYSVPLTRWLGENSYFYSLLFNRVWDYFKAKLASRSAAQDGAARPVNTAASAAEYAIPTVKIRSAYDVALAAALIERMARVCRERGIRFLVVDVPVRPARWQFSSSLPPPLLLRLKASGIEVIDSQDLFAALDGAVDLHVPNGHNHISEVAHTLIGAEIGRRLLPAEASAFRRP